MTLAFLFIRKLKKLLYLFLALLLPGLIFVFLKFAGKNEFSIPVYYQEGVDSLSNVCHVNYDKPYLLADSVWKLSGRIHHAANIMVFASEKFDFTRFNTAIHEEFSPDSVWVGRSNELVQDPAAKSRWKDCVFLMTGLWEVVVYDSGGRIRGYYRPDLREDMDRLRVELKILLKQY
jgi:hypothetical protein